MATILLGNIPANENPRLTPQRSSLASAASAPKIMTNIFRIFLCIFAFLLCVDASAADSLYDKKNARTLTSSEVGFFGPRASSYRYDSRMIRAAQIAQERARKHSTSRCWRYVKQALLAAGAVDSYPKTAYAKQAAVELPQSYGFKKLKTLDPAKAPVGAVLVYGGRDAGHVEIKTTTGYVSDFHADKPYTHKRPLIGIFVKPRV
jgi:hypothetical protein